nr:MAG TPA: hypothetical protein [Caudoviricetes sp.]
MIGCAPFRFSVSSYASMPIHAMMLSTLLPPTQTCILLTRGACDMSIIAKKKIKRQKMATYTNISIVTVHARVK